MIFDDRGEADAYARQAHGRLVEYPHADALGDESEVLADYTV